MDKPLSEEPRPTTVQRELLDWIDGDLAELGERGIWELLQRGETFQLANTLRRGGVLMFGHTRMRDCGHQVAACVQACLDSGAETVLALGVLHESSPDLEAARARVAGGADPRRERTRGVQGPGLDGAHWRGDHSLIYWRHLWDAEVVRRGLTPDSVPRVIERYPFLVAGDPESLPGIDELAEIAERSVIVATADPLHHGPVFGTLAEAVLEAGPGLAHARRQIESGIALLAAGDYRAFEEHCAMVVSDAADVSEVFRFLRGPLEGSVLDLELSDARFLYHTSEPTWVATALVDWSPPA